MTDQSTALVSVVIPCHNQARYLRTSIASAQRQSHPHCEVIVVDDGSIDDTAAIGHQCGATVIRQDNRGVSAARNRGLDAATGEYIVFLDADDELLANAVATGVAALSSKTDATCAVGRASPMDAEGRDLPSVAPRPIVSDLYRDWLAENFVPTVGAAIFRRTRLQALGGFQRDVGPAADYALYLQLARTNQVVDHGRVVVRYRSHSESMSRNASLMLDATMRVLRTERRFVPREHAAAYRHGRDEWAWFYGQQILEQLREDWRVNGPTGAQLHSLLPLIRHCPRFVVERLVSRTSRVLWGFWRHRSR